MKTILLITISLFATSFATMSGSATTTRYWDCSGGACGCGYGDENTPAFCDSNAMFAAPTGNQYGASFYGTAALSEELGGGYWLADGCGKCFKVTATSNIGSSSVQTTLVLKGTNFCPPSNSACNGKAHFDIAAPGFDYPGTSEYNVCSQIGADSALIPPQTCGYWMIDSQDPSENCACDAIENSILKQGCENFLSLQWNNPTIDYEEVDCPSELVDGPPCWSQNGDSWPSVSPATCSAPTVVDELPWSCDNGSCSQSSSGSYNTLSECESACQSEQFEQAEFGWSCNAGSCSNTGSDYSDPSCFPCNYDQCWGSSCANNNDDECGDECDECILSWPCSDPDQWNSNDAVCRCKILTKYTCSSGTCTESSSGEYDSLSSCQSACTSTKYTCSSGSCTESSSGEYDTLSDCEDACQAESGWSCSDGSCTNTGSEYSDEASCLAACISTYSYGGDCATLSDQLCGDSCAKCAWSWPSSDPDQWNSEDAACRCQEAA